MERERLEAYLSEGLSLNQIGVIMGRPGGTVGYWVAKYGLVANGKQKYAPRGGLTREELEPLVDAGATLQEMAHELSRSTSTVRYWLLKFGMKTKNRIGPRSKIARHREVFEAAIRDGVDTVTRRCDVHGETDFAVVRGGRRLHCKRCRSEAVSRRRRRVKKILVAEAGGQCVLCGYDRCLGALEFHHIDPTLKSFGIGGSGITRSIEALRKEIEKCVLLCANCHAEVGAGFTVLPLQFSQLILSDFAGLDQRNN